MPVNIDKVLGTQMLFKGASTAFVHWTVAQILVTISAIRKVLIQSHMDVVRLFEMMLDRLLSS